MRNDKMGAMICIPINSKNITHFFREFKHAQNIGDLTEIWFDELKISSQNLNKIFVQKRKPIIYKVTKAIDKKILKYVDYIDVDISLPQAAIDKIPKKIQKIISFHDFEKTPPDEELKKIAAKIMRKKADIVKIATFANNFADSIRMLGFLAGLSKRKKAICVCMGKEGKITRMAGHLFGNYLMYAPLKERSRTAQGQISAAKLKTIISSLCP